MRAPSLMRIESKMARRELSREESIGTNSPVSKDAGIVCSLTKEGGFEGKRL